MNTAVAAWTLVGLICASALVMTIFPDLRSTLTAGTSVAAVLIVLLGVRLHRPRTGSWLFLALTLAFWAVSTVLVCLQGYISPVAEAGVWAGQVVATGVTVHAILSGPRSRARSVHLSGHASATGTRQPPGSGSGTSAAKRSDHHSAGWSLSTSLDFVIISTVLAVVGVAIVRAATTDGVNTTALVVASVDVALLGMLLRFAVSRRSLGPSSVLVLLAAVVTIVYDLSSAVHGRRLALPGEATEIFGVACMLLFSAAALHPSMTEAFSTETFSRRRPASTALLGLLPLVLVPAAVDRVARLSGAQPLPAWAVPTAGAIVAGLCLFRASIALRSSEYLAEHDPLTDLANRRGLARSFQEAPADAQRSLLLIDVDEFKQINDTYGHDIGDAVLLQIRDRLLDALNTRHPLEATQGHADDTRTRGVSLPARFGGDEFVVLTSTGQVHQVAERFLRTLDSPFEVEGLVLKAGTSIGIAHAEPGMSLTDLLTQADVAMYAAKAAGGTRALDFDPAMRVEVARRFTLSSEIRQLLGRSAPDVGHLETHYQPFVDMRTGHVVGAEALVRWRHPRLGLLAPDAFLGLVSTNDLDADLDWAVLTDVIQQLVRWRDEGRRSLPVSVNLTRDSLEEPRLAERVLVALVDAGIPARQLHVEITEHQQVSPDSLAQQNLEQLQAAGVGVYLDDYGAGYTSLEYLHRFPVAVIKLDRSVIASLDQDEGHLLAGVKAMAAALKLDLLAEGVETAHQRDRLLELGIHTGQGYLFSRPLPPASYADSYLGFGEDDPTSVAEVMPARGGTATAP